MEEWDIVRPIFLNKMNCAGEIMQALDAESYGLWRDAQRLYLTVIGQDNSSDRRDFYYESCYRAFAELSEWSDLVINIERTVAGPDSDHRRIWTDLWDDDWNQHTLLPWYLKAQLRDMSNDSLLPNLEQAISDPNRSDYIRDNFSDVLAIAYLSRGAIEKAIHFLDDHLKMFVGSWSNANPFIDTLKITRLIQARNAADIRNFTAKLDGTNWIVYNDLEDTLRQWAEPENGDGWTSVVAAETRYTFRKWCTTVLRRKTVNNASMASLIDSTEYSLDMKLVDAATQLKNFYVAQKYLKAHETLFTSILQNQHQLEYHLRLTRLALMKAEIDPDGRLNQFIKALNIFGE